MIIFQCLRLWVVVSLLFSAAKKFSQGCSISAHPQHVCQPCLCETQSTGRSRTFVSSFVVLSECRSTSKFANIPTSFGSDFRSNLVHVSSVLWRQRRLSCDQGISGALSSVRLRKCLYVVGSHTNREYTPRHGDGRVRIHTQGISS